MHAGITTSEVQQRFSPTGWELLNAERASAQALGIGVRHADERFELWHYQLRRTAT
jgi:hypothetical protein